jgi:hypothetical protein
MLYFASRLFSTLCNSRMRGTMDRNAASVSRIFSCDQIYHIECWGEARWGLALLLRYSVTEREHSCGRKSSWDWGSEMPEMDGLAGWCEISTSLTVSGGGCFQERANSRSERKERSHIRYHPSAFKMRRICRKTGTKENPRSDREMRERPGAAKTQPVLTQRRRDVKIHGFSVSAVHTFGSGFEIAPSSPSGSLCVLVSWRYGVLQVPFFPFMNSSRFA